MKSRKITVLFLSLLTVLSLVGCSTQNNVSTDSQTSNHPSFPSGQESNPFATSQTSTETVILDVDDLFSDRDLKQTADLSQAVYYTVSDNTDIVISEGGIYVLSGSAKNVTIAVEAADDQKVQLVLDGLNIINENEPCLYVKEADKVFITTTATQNDLSVTGEFSYSPDEKADGVIFCRCDLTLNGVGTLKIESSDNAIVSKDDLKVTGGSYDITCENNALEANDSILICSGTLNIISQDDGLHAEDDDDDTTGYIYISGGQLTINAKDDAIHATALLQINGGNITAKAAEGLEATEVIVNDGTVNISASDDGINAARKSKSYYCFARFAGGSITVTMEQGDTDGIDVNGDLFIEGGTISITGQSAFDYDGACSFTGGTVYVNGQQISEITGQFMGGETFPSGQPGGRRR